MFKWYNWMSCPFIIVSQISPLILTAFDIHHPRPLRSDALACLWRQRMAWRFSPGRGLWRLSLLHDGLWCWNDKFDVSGGFLFFGKWTYAIHVYINKYIYTYIYLRNPVVQNYCRLAKLNFCGHFPIKTGVSPKFCRFTIVDLHLESPFVLSMPPRITAIVESPVVTSDYELRVYHVLFRQ